MLRVCPANVFFFGLLFSGPQMAGGQSATCTLSLLVYWVAFVWLRTHTQNPSSTSSLAKGWVNQKPVGRDFELGNCIAS